MNGSVRIILAEDHTLMRKALVTLLRERPDYAVVGEVSNGKELLDLLKVQEADIILLDLEMPVMNGWECLDILKNRFSFLKVIILSMYADTVLQQHFVAKGARSYLTKGCDADTLFKAIDSVMEEGYFIDTVTPKGSARTINPQTESINEIRLSAKETEILTMICNGKTNKEIARELEIASSTVDFHRSKIYGKTKSSNVTDLFKYAISTGIIKLN